MKVVCCPVMSANLVQASRLALTPIQPPMNMATKKRIVVSETPRMKLLCDDVTDNLSQFFNRIGQFVNFGLQGIDASHR